MEIKIQSIHFDATEQLQVRNYSLKRLVTLSRRV